MGYNGCDECGGWDKREQKDQGQDGDYYKFMSFLLSKKLICISVHFISMKYNFILFYLFIFTPLCLSATIFFNIRDTHVKRLPSIKFSEIKIKHVWIMCYFFKVYFLSHMNLCIFLLSFFNTFEQYATWDWINIKYIKIL